MKKGLFLIMFACCAFAMVAQDAIRVNYKGAKPTISDFAWAFLSSFDEEECGNEPINAVKYAFIQYRKGLPQEDGVTLTIDEKNGYILYENRYEDVVDKKEMCYWNEADGKHKLFVFNNMQLFANGKPVLTETSGLMFYRYNNSTKKMVYCDAPGFDVEYFDMSYSMPRIGKNIVVTKWHDDGTKTERTLKWNGRSFKF